MHRIESVHRRFRDFFELCSHADPNSSACVHESPPGTCVWLLRLDTSHHNILHRGHAAVEQSRPELSYPNISEAAGCADRVAQAAQTNKQSNHRVCPPNSPPPQNRRLVPKRFITHSDLRPTTTTTTRIMDTHGSSSPSDLFTTMASATSTIPFFDPAMRFIDRFGKATGEGRFRHFGNGQRGITTSSDRGESASQNTPQTFQTVEAATLPLLPFVCRRCTCCYSHSAR